MTTIPSLITRPAVKGVDLFVRWMIRSGGDLRSAVLGWGEVAPGSFLRLNAVDHFGNRFELDLSAEDAVELRDALNLHLANVGMELDAPEGPDGILTWTDQDIREVAPRLARWTNGRSGGECYMDQDSGDKFTLAAGEFILARARDLELATASADACRVEVINLRKTGNITDREAAVIMADLTMEGTEDDPRGATDSKGRFYTNAAVRALRTKTARTLQRQK